ncbi:single-stranded DNA-binding protein [Flavivirga jejuensis]|uniref:Single-stranded DNA-binding protein n=1 Tax=Flavivirga jejuensis TaxID=870487 RepID=A0ABT8WVC9_9FLAO|nr:single-stranded DNA-binding protein [Flavivirga jejuensis]MDO5977104.1 single-stranded DNA-binding protein [Flavivirga jejuensis]
MNTLKNKVQLIGNIGQDPIITNLNEGKIVARLSLATNESYKNAKGEKVTDTQWHNIVAWGKIAEIIEKYVKKGKEIAVAGRLVARSYQDKEGVKRSASEVVITEILLLSSDENTL